MAAPNSLNLAMYGVTHFGYVGTLAFLTITETGTNCGFKLRADPSGKFDYGFGNTAADCSGAPLVAGCAIDSGTGQLTPIEMPATVLGAAVDLIVTRERHWREHQRSWFWVRNRSVSTYVGGLQLILYG